MYLFDFTSFLPDFFKFSCQLWRFKQILFTYLPVREADDEEVGDDDDGGSNKFAEDEFLTMTPTVSKILALEMPVEAVELAFEAAATTGGV